MMHWQNVLRVYSLNKNDALLGHFDPRGPLLAFGEAVTLYLSEVFGGQLGFDKKTERIFFRPGADPRLVEAFQQMWRHPDTNPRAAIKAFQFVANFFRQGKRVFRIAPSLAARLDQTDLRKVPSELIRLPFPAIYIDVPRLTPPAMAYDGRGKAYELTGVYLVQHDLGMIEVMLAGSGQHGFDGLPGFEGVEESAVAKEIARIGDDQIYFLRFKLGPDIDLKDSVEQALGEAERSDRTRMAFERMWRIVFNAVLYINSPGADVSDPIEGEITRKLEAHPKKSEDWKESMRRKARREPVLIEVGRHFERSEEMEAAARGDAGEGKYALTCRFIVRGHWRYQRHGVGLMDTKLIWVEPFWKGPSLAEALEDRHYEVR